MSKTIAATINASLTVDLFPNAPEIYKNAAPFFDSSIPFYSDRSNYACLLCGVNTAFLDGKSLSKTTGMDGKERPETDDVAISYAGMSGRFAHIACLRKIPGATVSTDGKAKLRARTAAKKRREAAHENAKNAAPQTVTVEPTPKPAPTPAPQTVEPTVSLEIALRETIEQEYQGAINDACQAMEALMAENSRLEAEIERLTALLAPAIETAITTPDPEPADKKAERAARRKASKDKLRAA